VSEDDLTGSRRYRIILACKHTSSVNLSVLTELKEQMRLWEPPRVDELIVVTTGRFTTDAIAYVEKHNNGSEAMRIELWAGSHLERLLANRPELIAEFGLRP
jgi:Restriction endonuclease